MIDNITSFEVDMQQSDNYSKIVLIPAETGEKKTP